MAKVNIQACRGVQAEVDFIGLVSRIKKDGVDVYVGNKGYCGNV